MTQNRAARQSTKLSIQYLCLKVTKRKRLIFSTCTAAGNQTNLANLNLASNVLSGSIPSTLCTLSALETLNMSANDFTGANQTASHLVGILQSLMGHTR